MIVYGIPYSNTVLFLYGGSKLSEQGPGTRLLQANCAYIFIMALNGVTEAFTFAAMTQAQMDKYVNDKRSDTQFLQNNQLKFRLICADLTGD